MNSSKMPLIAVFGSRADKRKMQGIRTTYMNSVSLFGGIPVLAPMCASREAYRELAERCDGFLFAGGVDVHPKHYGESLLPECGEIDEERDESELLALGEILKTKKPVLGICRGIQILAVATGGTLYQDLPSQKPSDIIHSQKEPSSEKTHTVTIEKGSILENIFGETSFKTNSFHHQAVKTTTLTVSARADDGVIEGIEDRSHPYFVGVQWHPEFMTVTDVRSRSLFESFSDACKK